MSNFTHLHVHTSYSFLDGFNMPENAAKRAKELGMTHLAITDHNHLGGVIDFQKACHKHNIIPILGLEAYWTQDTEILSLPVETRNQMAIDAAKKAGVEILEDIPKKELKILVKPYSYDTTQYHILLLAMNQKGWNNLIKLQSEAAEKCTFNGRFLVDDKLLEKYNDNIIMATACIGNPVAGMILRGELQEAEAQIDKWHAIFKDRFYIEIQPLDIDKQHFVNEHLIKWAKNKDIPIIATNDVHYTLKEDHDDHDTLLCIGIGRKKADEDRLFYSNDFWMRSYEEMLTAFEHQYNTMAEEERTSFTKEEYIDLAIEALENTNKIAARIDSDIKLGPDKPMFPILDTGVLTPEEKLTLECFKGLFRYKKSRPDIDLSQYMKRLDHELNIINKKGFAPYILIVEEYVRWCVQNNIPVGPGRGSAAGSLILFVLGITKGIDPIKYDLLFSRFLTEDRTALPDVDMDFCYYGRPAVIEHLRDKYGKTNVSHIGTFTYMGVKSALKDVGRVLDIDFLTMNGITKKIDEILDKPGVKFEDLDALCNFDNEIDKNKYQEFKKLEENNPELFRLARRFEGNPRNYGIHASGILVTPIPISDIVPTRTTSDNAVVSIYTGEQLEDLNMLKLDILGLKTLSVIKSTLEHIDQNRDINKTQKLINMFEKMDFESLYDTIDVNDPKIFQMICKEETDGIFQIESNMFKKMISEIKPDSLNDIIAITALGRPGPLSAGMHTKYAARKNGKEKATEPLRGTWDTVKDTLGTICYQEQLMKISQVVAGFNDNQADSLLRKAVAKKKKDKMDLCRQLFIYGKVNEEPPAGYDPEDKDQVLYDPKAEYGAPIKGGISNNYDRHMLSDFWKDMENYASYLFNKSHAATYSYITIMTAYLKRYYPVEFMASLLSIQDKTEEIVKYVKVAEGMDIEIKTPDINISDRFFKPEPKSKRIYFGFNAIKGVGENSIPHILKARPFDSLHDMYTRIPKKHINKAVGIALIKAGAFDFEDQNRNALILRFHTYRGDKMEKLNPPPPLPEDYSAEACIQYEKEVLGMPITEKLWWDTVKPNKKIEETIELVNVREHLDKNNNMMAFIDAKIRGSLVKAIMFASKYSSYSDMFDTTRHKKISIKGKKDSQGSLIISSVSRMKEKPITERSNPFCLTS